MFMSCDHLTCAHLYSAVAPVCHDDVPIDIHSHTCGSVELAVAFTVGAEFQQEFPLCVEHLGNKDATGTRSMNTISLNTFHNY